MVPVAEGVAIISKAPYYPLSSVLVPFLAFAVLHQICKWGKLSRKLMKKHDGRGSMEARVNLARLARKLINRYKNGSSR